MNRTIDRLWAATGVIAMVVGFGAIGVAILQAPWFTWTGHALSNLGNPEHASSAVFNAGLMVTGVIGMLFAFRLFMEAETALEQLGLAIGTVAVADMILIGIFHIPHRWHFAVSVAFYAGLTYAWFVHGTGLVLAEKIKRGLGVIWLGIAHATGWILWVVVGTGDVAIPETYGAVLLAIWALDATRRLDVDLPLIERFKPAQQSR